uniref:Uncharacterized protein n=1 Tax=Arundo donax TaxID=35708 RepID=A0A0A8ZTI4_ARUDO
MQWPSNKPAKMCNPSAKNGTEYEWGSRMQPDSEAETFLFCIRQTRHNMRSTCNVSGMHHWPMQRVTAMSCMTHKLFLASA